MQKLKCDLTKTSQQLIVAGLAGLITDDGYTFHEAMEVLEAIKREVFPALMELSWEERSKENVRT